MKKIWLAAALASVLAACSPATTTTSTPETTATAPETPAVASGPAQQIELVTRETPEAGVGQIVQIEHSEIGAKLYSLTGGDPAINGVYVFLAYFDEDLRDGRVFQIGDFNEWSMAEQREDGVVLNVSESSINDAGDIVTAQKKLIVSIPKGGDTHITVTPAT